MELIFDLGKWTDAETGEIVNVTLPNHRLISKGKKGMGKIPSMPWIKLYRLPYDAGLKPSEWRVLGAILTPYQLKLGEGNNVICNTNGERARLYDIARQAFINVRTARTAIKGLKDKGIVAKHKGKYLLNWQVAIRGTEAIVDWSKELFPAVNPPNCWLKLYHLPFNLGLKPKEWEILGAIINNKHIRAKDNVIVCSNGRLARIGNIAKWASINDRTAKVAMKRLRAMHIIGEYDGSFVLSWLVAIKGNNVITRWSKDLFQKLQCGHTSAGVSINDG